MSSLLLDLSYRAPILGSVLMCFACALVGSVVFLKKRSLVGEAVAHATYPGAVIGGFFAGSIAADPTNPFFLFFGAMSSSLLGLWWVDFLQRKWRFSADSALCVVLSSFIGFGVLLASQLQFAYPLWHQKIQVLLYGQAALLRDSHLWIYVLLSGSLCFGSLLFSSSLRMVFFDQQFAKLQGVNVHFIELITMIAMCMVLVFGIKSVGVIMVSGMLVAPSVAARYWCDRYLLFQGVAALIGALSGFLGVVIAIGVPFLRQDLAGLPTGPLILIISSFLALLSMLFSPKYGLLPRKLRAASFKLRCLSENALKALWKENGRPMAREEIFAWHPANPILGWWTLHALRRQGWLTEAGSRPVYQLTKDGQSKAQNIVRLHRLWEAYLVYHVGMPSMKVHRSAEEMEHIMTPEIEARLLELIGEVKEDPHDKPIPERRLL